MEHLKICLHYVDRVEETTDEYVLFGDEYVLKNDPVLLQNAKDAKYEEANLKAFQYLESGEAVFEFEEGKSIEATDGNIAKLGLALVNFILQQDYSSTIEWNTKENENVQLNATQLTTIVAGLQAIQSNVWTVQFPAYNSAISEATTIEEVEAIEVDYES